MADIQIKSVGLRLNGHVFVSTAGTVCVRCGLDLIKDLFGYGSNTPICRGKPTPEAVGKEGL